CMVPTGTRAGPGCCGRADAPASRQFFRSRGGSPGGPARGITGDSWSVASGRQVPLGGEILIRQSTLRRGGWMIGGCLAVSVAALAGAADEPSGPPRASIDGTGPGWQALGGDDFVNVNGDPDTWTWKDGGVRCTGKPVGVTRTRKAYTN